MFQHIFDLEMKEENLYDSVAFWGEPLLKNIFTLSNETYGCLFICSYTVAIIKYSTMRNTAYFLFDSYCKNTHEITKQLV